MTSDDELRDKLTKALTGIVPMGEFASQEFKRWQAIYLTDALMPVVREALADAWSTGFREGRNADHQSCWWPNNPWRVGD